MSLYKISSNIVRPGTRSLASALLTKSENDWLAKSAADLRREAKARGLSQSGTKVEITRRLMEAERQAVHYPSERSAAANTSLAQQSTARTFTSSAKWNQALETPTSQFTPRRPYLLDVKIPEPPVPIEEGPIVPYLPDFFQSHHTKSASPIHQPPSEAPRVLTVASAATHEGGGPSHGLYGKATDPHLHEVHGDEAAAITSTSVETSGYREPGIVADILEELGLSGVKVKGFPVRAGAGAAAIEAAETSATVVKDVVQDVRSTVQQRIEQPNPNVLSNQGASGGPTTDKLKPEEVRGLYALAGIISVGYLLSKIFA